MPLSLQQIRQKRDGNTLYLLDCGLSSEDMVILSQYMKSAEASSVTELDLWANREIGDKGGEKLSEALLLSPYCHLEALNLSCTGISHQTINILSKYIVSEGCSLKILDLYGNGKGIGDKEVEILCSALSSNTSLTKLILMECNITNEGAERLLHILNHQNTTLSWINLGGNNAICDEKLQQVQNLAKSNNRNITRQPGISQHPSPILSSHSPSPSIHNNNNNNHNQNNSYNHESNDVNSSMIEEIVKPLLKPLYDHISEQQNQISLLKNSKKKLKSSLSKMKRDISSDKSKISEQQNQISLLNNSIRELKGSNFQLQTTISHMNDRISQQEREISSDKSKISALERMMSTQQNIISEQQKEISLLNISNSELRSTLSNSEVKVLAYSSIENNVNFTQLQ